MSAFEGRFEGFADEIEEAIAEAADGEKSDGRLNDIQQKAIKQKVVSIVERRLNADPGEEAGAAKAFAAKGNGGRGNGLVGPGDRAAAIKNAGTEFEGSARSPTAVAKADSVEGIKRRVALLKGTAEPKAPPERHLANLTGEKKERAVSIIEKQVADEDGLAGAAKAMKDYGDEFAEQRREERDEWMQRQHESITTPDY